MKHVSMLMKKKTTMENNKLIAEFMGYDISTIASSGVEVVEFESKDTKVENLKYHTSWDWLMPVVERINNTHSDTYGNYYSFQIGNGFVWVDPHMGSRIFFSGNDIDHKDEPMISKVHRGVVEFIKEYNDEQ